MIAPRTKLLVLVAALACIGAAVNQWRLPVGKVTVRVVDEMHKPVPGARATFVFDNPLNYEPAPFAATTNVEGFATGEGAFGPAGFGLDITKKGYYGSGAPIPKYSKLDSLTNHWLPWNQTYTTVLRPIGTPVALYAKSSWITLPAAGQACGYDLQLGDWVAPYGKGRIADLLLTYSGHFESMDNVDVAVAIRFSNPGDGIQPALLPAEWSCSEFRWPRSAPDAGYVPTLVSHFAHLSRQANFDISEPDAKCYFFRVRTVEKDGRIISALYGKIRGGLALAPYSPTVCKVHLTYYLNPTPLDRNLEWDPKRNLIPGLKFQETPREP